MELDLKAPRHTGRDIDNAAPTEGTSHEMSRLRSVV
jgi:hypothetical protein